LRIVRAFAVFFGLILAGMAAMALLAYPAWSLLTPAFDVPFHRVASRIGMLALLIGFILVARRLGVADRASLGYGAPRKLFLRELAIALVVGAALMLPVVAAIGALGLREWKPDAEITAALAVEGLLRGLAVALIEETFLRGAMFTAIARESGARAAIILTRIPADQVTFGSGWDLLAGSLAAFDDPLSIADAFISLLAVGVLLGMVRHYTGNIAACLGLHAGWVWVIAFARETTSADRSHPLAFLVSDFDGLVGWLVLAWTVVIAAILYFWYGRRRPR
jgi:membrane protease YdiL (CAAX protease family)